MSNECTPIPKPVYKKKKSKRPAFQSGKATHCHWCGIEASDYVIIEKHHIVPVGMGGTNNPDTADPNNEVWLCKGVNSNHCHDHAQQYREGYMPDDLRKAKEDYKNIINDYKKITGMP